MNIKRGLWLILALAMLLRLMLGIVNRAANDNHLDVVNILVNEHRLPEKTQCWSCYQPKLYYIICAGVVNLFGVQEDSPRVLTMQLVNVAIAFFLLLLLLLYINKQKLATHSKYVVFAFFAFNPCLAGINIQGTNDTLAIFCGVLAMYAADSFFRNMKVGTALLLAVALLAGVLTKASMIVLTVVIFMGFAVKVIADAGLAQRGKTAKYFFPLLFLMITIVPFAGGYYHNYKTYGSLSLSTWEKDAPPFFYTKTPVTRPGLENMREGFFTFKWKDLIRQPYINNEWDNYPPHRTSLWSQLYGRTVFMHFDQWPPSWQSHEPNIVSVGKALVILGILPLLLFILGVLSNALGLVKRIVTGDRLFFTQVYKYLPLVVTMAFLASSVYYTYNYRDFSSMKSIYIFPGMLAFIKMFTDGFALLKLKAVMLFAEVVLILMVILSIADILLLYKQLYAGLNLA
jgi:hypothetical protein